MSPRWLARVVALLLAAWMLGAASLRAQECSPTDTLHSQRRGGNLWYLTDPSGVDTLRHASGSVRGFATEGNALLYGVWILEVTGRRLSARNTSMTDIVGCIPSSPVDGRDTTAVPPATDSLPPIISPEPTPQDTVAPDPGIPSARGVITCQPEALCSGDAHASVGDSVVWMAETGPGTAVRLGDFQGLQWGPRVVSSPRARTWWVVAWSGAGADTARVVWTVPVTASTTYPAAPLDSPPAPTGFTWLLIDPRLPGGLITYPGPDSTWTPRQECATARVVAGLTIWQPTDTLGWSNRFGSLGQTLATCQAVTP